MRITNAHYKRTTTLYAHHFTATGVLSLFGMRITTQPLRTTLCCATGAPHRIRDAHRNPYALSEWGE
jgi:hypothetical protein